MDRNKTGSKNEEWLQRNQRVVMNTYGRFPVAFVRGEGSLLIDADGKEYLDCLSGLAVCSLGHSHPVLSEAIQRQAATLLHTSNLYVIPRQVELAEKLVSLSFAERVFFCNSGAEANEAAVKLARLYQHRRGSPEKKEIVSFERSFHGRTLAMITATGQKKYQEGFDPLPDGFTHIPFGNLAAAEQAVDEKTAAVLVEAVQMEGGVHAVPKGFLKHLRTLCDKHDALLILDEVQTGIGRTGEWFAYQQEGITPDIITLAKGLGGGVPIGAMLASASVAEAFVPGTHAATFGGNPLSCAAALAVLETIEAESILEAVRRRSAYLFRALHRIGETCPCVREVRGRGYLIGIELDREALPMVKKLMERGVLTGIAGPNVLRLLPPLTITQYQLDRMIAHLHAVLSEK